jgi:hypothetical protein
MKEEFQSLIIKHIGLTKTFHDTLSELVDFYLENKKTDLTIAQDISLLMGPDFKHQFMYCYE